MSKKYNDLINKIVAKGRSGNFLVDKVSDEFSSDEEHNDIIKHLNIIKGNRNELKSKCNLLKKELQNLEDALSCYSNIKMQVSNSVYSLNNSLDINLNNENGTEPNPLFYSVDGFNDVGIGQYPENFEELANVVNKQVIVSGCCCMGRREIDYKNIREYQGKNRVSGGIWRFLGCDNVCTCNSTRECAACSRIDFDDVCLIS